MQIVLILLFLALPLLELALLIKVGAAIGALATIGLLILGGIIGGLVIQAQGLSAFRRTMEELQRGEPPLEPMVEGALLCFAGGLFIVPGFLTDVAAVVLLIPPVRRWLARSILGNTVIVTRTTTFRQNPEPPGDGPVIEGEYKRIDDPKEPPARNGRRP